ncbi:ice-binding family protein [Flavobacterium sp.]
MPMVSLAQISPAPVLGTTSNFLLFTAAGDITNAGTTSTYYGSVGTNAGTLSGFSLLITPPTHLYSSTPETAQCATDLNILYNDLVTRTGTVRTGAYVTETLTAGVYTTAGAINIGSLLTLDGGGDPNARFIIKTGGAFTMAASAKILLTNGTQSKNVFWVIAGACSIAANCEARGTFICYAGAISMGADCTMEGSALTLAGAITTLDGMKLSTPTQEAEVTNGMILSANQTITTGTIPADLVLTGNISPVIKWQSSSNSNFSSTTDILHYSTTLSGSCIGTISATTYYRAVILIDGVDAYSNTVKITVSAPIPELGAASAFVLFTTAGAITNTGLSTSYIGGIGTQAGAITGFADLTNPLLHTSDALTLACKNHLQELFTTIAGYTTTNTTHPVAFGSGETLLPGIYAIGAAATTAGILTLDGQNNPNALFIIKITGALALAAGTEIKLINGASKSNIFWVIDGALALGANCTVAGTFICQAGAIAIGNSSVINGRIFTIAGAITLANTAFTSSTTNNYIPTNTAIISSASQLITSGAQPADITITGNSNPVVRWEKSSDISFTSPAFISNTTATLLGSTLGALNATTYIRAIVSNGTTLASSTISTVSVYETIIAGVINSNQIFCSASTPDDLVLIGNNIPVVKWQRSLTPDFLSATDINSNDTTLTGTTIGSISVTTYFRAVVQYCTLDIIYSAPAIITIETTTSTDGGISWSNGLPSISKSIVFDGAVGTISANFSACSFKLINNAVVTVSSGFDVTLNGTLTIDPGSTFILENNANLLQSTTSANSGTITVKSSSSLIKRLDYTLWSSPVAQQNILSFSPNTLVNRFYSYNTLLNMYEVIPSVLTATFAEGNGYLIRTPNAFPIVPTTWNGVFEGIPNNGTINVPLVNGDLGNRFNLVGNPYPSGLDASAFVNDNSNAITGALYFWRKTNNALSPSYCTWTTTGFVDNGEAQVFNPNDVIDGTQGFFVEAKENATNLIFNNTQRVGHTSGQFFRTQNIERNRIWLNATGAGAYSQLLLGYVTDATAEEDFGLDAKYNNDGSIGLSSLIGTVPYAIQSRALPFDPSDRVSLRFKASNAGSYTIAIHQVDGLFLENQPIYLKDLFTGTQQDLKLGAYTFNSEAGTFNERFEVVYQATLAITEPTFNESEVTIFKTRTNEISVKTGTITMSSIKIFDVLGKLLLEKNDINSSEIIIDSKLSAEILLFKIISDGGDVVTKKVLFQRNTFKFDKHTAIKIQLAEDE